jgi:hypothetical protein
VPDVGRLRVRQFGTKPTKFPRESTHLLSLAKRPQTDEPNFPLIFRQDRLARERNLPGEFPACV